MILTLAFTSYFYTREFKLFKSIKMGYENHIDTLAKFVIILHSNVLWLIKRNWVVFEEPEDFNMQMRFLIKKVSCQFSSLKSYIAFIRRVLL